MPITHIALLAEQYRLQQMPRTMERFQEYLNTITNADHTDVGLAPLVAANPMAREHVTERLAEYLAVNIEQVAAEAVMEAQTRLGTPPEEYKHGLVVMDDVKGGWTNRASIEMGAMEAFSTRGGWLSTGLWVSEPATPDYVRQTILHSIFRIFYMQKHGSPRTLRERMQQEGRAMAFAGKVPILSDEDIAYTRHVIAPLLDTNSYVLSFAALLGDEAARSMGYEPLGVSPRAGLEVALVDALIEAQNR
jgi:hypothetical protein